MTVENCDYISITEQMKKYKDLVIKSLLTEIEENKRKIMKFAQDILK